MDIWIAFAVGAFVGVAFLGLAVLYAIGKWYVGDLREDNSTGDERPYYFMEIAQGAISHVRTNRFVLLRVKRENYVTKPTPD